MRNQTGILFGGDKELRPRTRGIPRGESGRPVLGSRGGIEFGSIMPRWAPLSWADRLDALAASCGAYHEGLADEYNRWAAKIRSDQHGRQDSVRRENVHPMAIANDAPEPS